MTDSVKVINLPDSGSPERVAYELMTRIAYLETAGKENPRDYFLELYKECIFLVRNGFRQEEA